MYESDCTKTIVVDPYPDKGCMASHNSNLYVYLDTQQQLWNFTYMYIHVHAFCDCNGVLYYALCCELWLLLFNLKAQDPEGTADVPLHVINNYFSVGSDAQHALEFHLGRGKQSLYLKYISPPCQEANWNSDVHVYYKLCT